MDPGSIQDLNDHSYLPRLAAIIIPGAIGALALTWFMHELITSTQQRLDESGRAHMIDFVRLKRDETSETKQRKLERPKPTEAPPTPAAPQDSSADATISVSVAALPAGFGDITLGGLGLSGGDGEYLPIVKVAPIYPKRASMKGIEGQCVVMYTVTTNGSTRDVVVIEEMCDNPVFYRSSVEAAKKFKYKPRVIDGEAIEVHRVTNRFIYELADGG
jgi:protein TonB